ncbi:YhgE/Pip domain-containing protein [Actinomyces faecalis]|uniref:YhgE/Pip domain-containing protein n=1 Tax=Actinomyces faecalis TaxID=2722820 RepID=UPI00155797E8|nr:YhgE/Pip domain-containing protein [Actinomyces faecalis]
MKKLTGSRIGNLVVVAAVVIIPLLYAGLLTLTYQDPTNRLDDIRAAVVNEDSPYTATLASGETRTLDLGADLEEALTEPDGSQDVGFTWTSMSESEARAQMGEEKIRAILFIPADFSQKVSLVGTEDPSKAATQELHLLTDDGINYLAGTMALTVASELSNQLSSQGSEEVVDSLLLSVSTIREGMVTASDGATTLADGTTTLSDGATTLADGTDSLSSGASSLTVGVKQLADGSVTLASGLTTLSQGATDAADGSQQLADGVARLASGASSARTGASTLADGARTLSEGTSTLAANAGTLADGVGRLSTGSGTLADGVTRYTQGVDQVAAGAAALQVRATDPADGLAAGITQLKAGIGEAGSTDTSTLAGGAAALDAGAAQLSAGLNSPQASGVSLKDGAAGLASGITTAQQGVAGYTAAVDQLAAQCSASGAAPALCVALQQVSSQSAALNAGMSEASSAATQVSDGVSQAADGAARLAASTSALSQGTTTLREGVDRLGSAVGSPSDVTVPGDSSSPQTLLGGINAVAGGLGQVTTSTVDGHLVDNSASLRQGASDVAGGLATMNDKVPALTTGISRLDSGAASLSDGATSLASGLVTLDQGTGTAATSAQTLADGVARLASGASSAQTGSQTLADGLGTAQTGSQTLSEGATRLATGAHDLKDGADQLDEGAATLSRGLAEGVGKIPSYSHAQRSSMAAVASDVARVETVRDNAVVNNGAGFTPMFMSLALWVGAIALFLVLPALDKRDHGERWWASAIRPATTALLLALAQAVIMMVVVNAAGELHASNLLGLTLMAIASSVCFMAINQACVASLAFRGRFVSIVLLSLQITSMGATFPIETAPRFFQWIHPLLPMSYTQLSFRRLIAGGGLDGIHLQTLGVLLIWTAIAVVVTLVGAKLRRGHKPLPVDNALAPTAA